MAKKLRYENKHNKIKNLTSKNEAIDQSIQETLKLEKEYGNN